MNDIVPMNEASLERLQRYYFSWSLLGVVCAAPHDVSSIPAQLQRNISNADSDVN